MEVAGPITIYPSRPGAAVWNLQRVATLGDRHPHVLDNGRSLVERPCHVVAGYVTRGQAQLRCGITATAGHLLILQRVPQLLERTLYIRAS